jgi:hypothetical protein
VGEIASPAERPPERRSFLRKYGIPLACAAVALGFALFVFLAPYLTVHELLDGVREHDAAKVSECVDYPALRESLKSQLRNAAPGVFGPDNPLARLGVGLTLGDAIVDGFVSPEGLARMMAGQKPTLAPGFSNAPEVALLVGASYGYESLSEFVVSVPAAGGAIRFVLTRSGLSWKLSRIELPLSR